MRGRPTLGSTLIELLHESVERNKRKDLVRRIQEAYARGDKVRNIAREHRISNTFVTRYQPDESKRRRAQEKLWEQRRAYALKLRLETDAKGRPKAYAKIGLRMGISAVAARKLVLGHLDATIPRRARKPNPYDSTHAIRPARSDRPGRTIQEENTNG